MAEKQIARNDELTASFKTISVNNPIRRVSDASQPSSGVAVINVPPHTRTSSEPGTRFTILAKNDNVTIA
jgi:hypothetical protein